MAKVVKQSHYTNNDFFIFFHSTICGVRVRVEYSTGKSSNKQQSRGPPRGPPPRSSSSRRPFDPNDRCYECGERGHYAYDCRKRQDRMKRGGSRSRYNYLIIFCKSG